MFTTKLINNNYEIVIEQHDTFFMYRLYDYKTKQLLIANSNFDVISSYMLVDSKEK